MLLAGALHRAREQIHFQIADRQFRDRTSLVAPMPKRAHAREQFARGERLGEIIVGARVQALDAMVFLAKRGEDQHRRRHAAGAQMLDDRDAVLLRQHAIEHDDVIAAIERRCFAEFAVIGHIDGVPIVLKRRLETVGHVVDRLLPAERAWRFLSLYPFPISAATKRAPAATVDLQAATDARPAGARFRGGVRSPAVRTAWPPACRITSPARTPLRPQRSVRIDVRDDSPPLARQIETLTFDVVDRADIDAERGLLRSLRRRARRWRLAPPLSQASSCCSRGTFAELDADGAARAVAQHFELRVPGRSRYAPTRWVRSRLIFEALPSTVRITSPWRMPARAAGPSGTTLATSAPVDSSRPKLWAMSSSSGWIETPIQPRVTWPA